MLLNSNAKCWSERGGRIRASAKRSQELGILDDKGNLLVTNLPSDLGWSIEDTAKMLTQESTKTQENDENYAS